MFNYESQTLLKAQFCETAGFKNIASSIMTSANDPKMPNIKAQKLQWISGSKVENSILQSSNIIFAHLHIQKDLSAK